MNSFLSVVLDSFENEKKRLEVNFDGEPEIIMEGDEKDLEEIKEIQSLNPKKKTQKFENFLNDNKIFLKKCEIQRHRSVTKKRRAKSRSRFSLLKHAFDTRTLLFFAYNGFTRKLVKKIISSETHLKIVHFFLFLGMLNFVLSSFKYTSNDNIRLMLTAVVFDYLVYIFFMIEVLLKIIANGLLCGETAFLRGFYNIINLLGILGFLILRSVNNDMDDSVIVDVAFIFKALLPLRILEHYYKLNALALSLKQSLDQILNVARALLIVWFIYILYSLIYLQFF